MQLVRSGGQPLFRQIEGQLSYEIVTGRRAGGSRLASLREAAAEWGVNLHTVRRAYSELEDRGLVETGRGGTRVAHLGPDDPQLQGLEGYLRRVLEEVAERFGASTERVIGTLRDIEQRALDGGRTTCTVIECSTALSESMARALATRFDVAATPQDLLSERSLPPGPIVATYFHADEIRSLPGGDVADLYLVRIRTSRRMLSRLGEEIHAGNVRRLVLMDRLPDSAQDLMHEFQSELGPDLVIEVRVARDPMLAFPEARVGTVVLATPQTWDRITSETRSRQDVWELEYEIEPLDLEKLGERLGLSVL